MMTRDDMQERLTFILGHPGETADISQKLNEVRTGFDDSLRQVEILDQRAKALQETNEKLVKQNMELFLQAASKPDDQEEKPAENTDEVILASLVDSKTGKFKLA